MRRFFAWLLMATMLLTPAVSAYAQAPVTLAGFEDEGTNNKWENNLFFQRMTGLTGVELSFTQYGNAAEWTAQKAAMLDGSAALPDVMFKAELTTQETVSLYEAGKLIDLRPYLEEHAPHLWAVLQENPDWLEAITLPGGAIAALPCINQLQTNNAMWINTAWLEALRLELPTDWQSLTDVLRAFRDKDPNMNGRKDEVPLTFLSLWDLKFLGHAFGLVTNDYGVYMDENGTVHEMLTSRQNRDFLSWLNLLWEEKLIDQNGFLNTENLRQITESDATIPYGMMLAATPLSVIPAAKLDDYSLLMPLVYEDKQIYRDLGGDLIRGTFAITSACEDPAAMVRWVDYLYTEEGFRLAQSGLEGEEYTWNDDGTWTWLADTQTVASYVLPQATILDGASMPGLCSIPFQLAYEDRQTNTALKALHQLKSYSVSPYPLVYLTQEQNARIAELWMDLGYYAELTMTRFVTGDEPLTNENWDTFCRTLNEKGLQEMVTIWQEAAR